MGTDREPSIHDNSLTAILNRVSADLVFFCSLSLEFFYLYLSKYFFYLFFVKQFLLSFLSNYVSSPFSQLTLKWFLLASCLFLGLLRTRVCGISKLSFLVGSVITTIVSNEFKSVSLILCHTLSLVKMNQNEQKYNDISIKSTTNFIILIDDNISQPVSF